MKTKIPAFALLLAFIALPGGPLSGAEKPAKPNIVFILADDWGWGDLKRDRTHPSESGQRKVAELLMKFFKTDATTRPWFVASQ